MVREFSAEQPPRRLWYAVSQGIRKRFEEALRKAKESPDEGRPLREFDLD